MTRRAVLLVTAGAVVVFSLAVGLISARARHVNTTWQRAEQLNLGGRSDVRYQALSGTGDVRFYSMVVTKPQTVELVLDVPRWAERRFHPQVVVYQPDTVTAGPGLPMVQPPATIASVYPLGVAKNIFDRRVFLSVTERLRASISLPVAGTYYLAVYNADREPGRYRLSVTSAGEDAAGTLWEWPRDWWSAQTWSSRSGLVAYMPVVIVLIVLGLLWHLTRTELSQPLRKKP